MIDVTCCLVNNLNLSKKDAPCVNYHAKNIISGAFETAVSDGYKRFLIAVRNYVDVEIAEILLETRDNLGSADLTIEAVVERHIFFEEKCIVIESAAGELNDIIKNCIIKFDGIIVYRENYRGLKFYNINHYLLNFSTRAILLYKGAEVPCNEKAVDDFFISHMLHKDVKKILLN